VPALEKTAHVGQVCPTYGFYFCKSALEQSGEEGGGAGETARALTVEQENADRYEPEPH
jgi:hypothetical protein